MTDIKSILAATDFSADAQNAVERAAILCKSMGLSNGSVLHVVESLWLDNLRQIAGFAAETEKSILNAAPEALDKLIAEVRENTGFKLEAKVVVGKSKDKILETSAEFDLLVLGAHGKHPLRDFAIGTTAERLLRQSRTPVLVVRHKPEQVYQRILVATDFSAHAQKALAFANQIAAEAEIHLAHVFESFYEGQLLYAGISDETVSEYRIKARNEAEVKMANFIKSSGLKINNLHRSIEHGSHVPTKLHAKATEINADLVVVGRHGKSIAEHLLLGSVTLHLLAESQCDVLVTQ
jgi:nucleotide-binding universal stress UspA family protein